MCILVFFFLQLSRCIATKVIIAMVDTRITANWKGDGEKANIAITSYYAKSHNYEFRVYTDAVHNMVWAAWIKVTLLLKLFEEETAEPTLILLLDSDAFIASPDTDLMHWLTKHGVDFTSSSWSIMISQESEVRNHFSVPLFWNTGAIYAYKDVYNTRRLSRTIEALRQWEAAACNDLCSKWRFQHAFDQKCLEVLYLQLPLFKEVFNRTTVHMNVFNGPWGQFVRHLWGGPGKELRNIVQEDLTARYLIDVERTYMEAMQDQKWPRMTFPVEGCIKPKTAVRMQQSSYAKLRATHNETARRISYMRRRV